MSSYPFKAKGKTKSLKGLVFIGMALDDYFGDHIYGYRVEGSAKTMRAAQFNERYIKIEDKLTPDEVSKAFNLTGFKEDEKPTTIDKDDPREREFILTDACMWEQQKQGGTFHPHCIEVVDTETGQMRYIESGARIKFVDGAISGRRTQEDYNNQ